jgi:hypothetical protein
VSISDDILKLSSDPMRTSSYVIGALKSDPSLPFEMERLKALVQMEAGSWRRHQGWILEIGRKVSKT